MAIIDASFADNKGDGRAATEASLKRQNQCVVAAFLKTVVEPSG